MTNGDAKNKHIALAYSIAYNSCVFNRPKGAQIVLFGFFAAHQNRWVSKSNCHPPFGFSDIFLCYLTIRRKWIGLKKQAVLQENKKALPQSCKNASAKGLNVLYSYSCRPVTRLNHCNLSTIPKKGCKNSSPPKSGLFKEARKMYNSSGAGRHEIALPL